MTSSTNLVFSGSYAAAGQPGVRAFAFDSETGTLAPCGEFCGIEAPSFLAVHPQKQWLYAVSETSLSNDGTAGHVHALSFERSGDGVTFAQLNDQPSGGDWPCHVHLDPAGDHLVVSNYGSGSFALLPIRTDGSLGVASAFVAHQGHGANPERQEAAHVHSTIFTPDGAYVIVADLGIDALVTYRVENGRVAKVAEAHTTPGAGPRHMLFHPSGRVLYVTNELNGTLCAYDYSDGCLRTRESYETLPEDFPQNLVADLHLSPAGDFLFVSNRGHNSLAVFAVSPEGGLKRVVMAGCGGNWPRNFALSPDGRYLLVANQYSGEIVSLPVRMETGEIGAAVARYPLPKAACIVFAPETLRFVG